VVSRHNDSFLTDSVAFYARIPAFLAFVITDRSIPVGTFSSRLMASTPHRPRMDIPASEPRNLRSAPQSFPYLEG